MVTRVIGLALGFSVAGLACSAQPTSSETPERSSAGSQATETTGGMGGSISPGGQSGLSDTGGTSGASNAAGSANSMAGAPMTTGDAGSPGAGDPCVSFDSQEPLPVAVDGPFVPGGYFAGPRDPSPNLSGISSTACEMRPVAALHFGECHKYSFKASVLESMPLEGTLAGAYGGVFWLAGSDTNWGTSAGVNIAPGARSVKFKAWGAVGGEVVTFSVGGVTGKTCADSVAFPSETQLTETLTTTPTEYSFNLKGATYPRGVIGGFSWSTKTTSTNAITTFYLDDIRWTAEAP
ncbi:MAG: hypothetical protein ABJB12_07860 [Pseudomonadota bacterium]